MSISPNTQAVLLLTSHFSKAKGGSIKPLTPKEWGRFALWLKEKSLTPEQLMIGRLSELLNGWSDKTITLDRIEGLMERGSALALAMEKWLRAGLWVMTRSDSDYPVLLKQRLRTDSPALLFGCGNRTLLNGGGLAVIGSRNVTGKDLAYSRDLGAMAARNGYSIVSGGARGVDEASMLGALEAEGTVVGVLADSLLRACSSTKYRSHLMANNLVLISTSYPDAGFNAGNAMQRNKYIYCLSDAALAVQSGTKGGTWSGAMENLKKQWVPLWVKRTTDNMSGNSAIVKAGAAWAPENSKKIDFKVLFSAEVINTASSDALSVHAAAGVNENKPEYLLETQVKPEQDRMISDGVDAQQVATLNQISQLISDGKVDADASSSAGAMEFYDLFLIKVQAVCSDSVKTTDELVDALGLNKSQLNTWLKRAVADQKMEKLFRPVRYQCVTTQQGALPV